MRVRHVFWALAATAVLAAAPRASGQPGPAAPPGVGAPPALGEQLGAKFQHALDEIARTADGVVGASVVTSRAGSAGT